MKYSLKKFLGLYLLLLLLIPTSIYVGTRNNKIGDTRSKAAQYVNKINFWPSIANLKNNQSYEMELRVDAETVPENIDLVLSFNPQVIQIEGNGPIPGNLFSIYQARFFDNIKGIFGLGGKNKTNAGNVFETVKFKTISPGDPNIKVNYLNSGSQKLELELPQYTVELNTN